MRDATWWKAVIAGAALVLAAAGSAGDDGSPRGEVSPIERVHRPCLLLATAVAGEFVEAPVQATEVEITVRGPLARARVRQLFSNPSGAWVEGVYAFPLPASAAVDRLRMVVGDRTIEGRIMERRQARRTYEQARSEGRKASLVEQERPNIFTTSVANIGPDETVEVVIEYQETLRFADGGFALRFPMVVGPRYVPGSPIAAGAGGTGWAPDTDAVTDAARITPPVDLGGGPPRNPVRLAVDLDPGMPLDRLDSPSHAIRIRQERSHRVRVSIDALEVPADRDFVLEWRPSVGEAPRAAVFTEDFEAEAYALVMVVPPAADVAETVRLPRETVFVIDTSGSMHGDSIGQARAALDFALGELRPDDEFNVIQFNSVTSKLFEGSRQAFPAAVDAAREYVARLEAEGGTEMLPALDAALADGGSATAVRQVVFITDGCVGNEDELFRHIQANLGRSRLFTVGIGSAPNSHFMERSARFGRGTFTYIGHPRRVEEKMRELFRAIDTPVVTDLQVWWPDAAADAYPQRLPDLYRDEPLVVAARMATLGGEVLVTGMRGIEPWQVRLDVDVAEARGGVHQLWARRKIAALMDRLADDVAEEEVRAEVLPVALRHHLTSRFTSLAAVDVTPTRPAGEGLAGGTLPTNLPHGWDAAKVFGELPQGSTPGTLLLLVGFLAMVLGLMTRTVPRGWR